MNEIVLPVIVAVERLCNGIMVKFADGRCAFYSASLLYATMPQAEVQDEELVAW